MDYKKEYERIKKMIEEEEAENEKKADFLLENFLKNQLKPPIKGKITSKKIAKRGLVLNIYKDTLEDEFYLTQNNIQISQTFKIDKNTSFLYRALYEIKAKDLIFNERITHLYVNEEAKGKISYIKVYFDNFEITITYDEIIKSEHSANLYIFNRKTQEKNFSRISKKSYLEILDFLKKCSRK